MHRSYRGGLGRDRVLLRQRHTINVTPQNNRHNRYYVPLYYCNWIIVVYLLKNNYYKEHVTGGL